MGGGTDKMRLSWEDWMGGNTVRSFWFCVVEGCNVLGYLMWSTALRGEEAGFSIPCWMSCKGK